MYTGKIDIATQARNDSSPKRKNVNKPAIDKHTVTRIYASSKDTNQGFAATSKNSIIFP